MPRKKKHLRLTVADVAAAHEALEEQERERMSYPKPIQSYLPPAPSGSRRKPEPPDPKPVKRMTPDK